MIMADHRHRSKRYIWRSRRHWRPAALNTNSDAWPEQRATWLREAAAVLDGPEAVASMVQTALAPPTESATIVDSSWVAQSASRVLAVMEESRSTWQMWHVRAEPQRQVHTIDMPAEHAPDTGRAARR
jgi:hypothetical protein